MQDQPREAGDERVPPTAAQDGVGLLHCPGGLAVPSPAALRFLKIICESGASYRWQLSGHLLPHFARMRLDQIGPEDVGRYKAAKLRDGALGPNQINKSIGLPAMILDAAGDYGHVDPARNPARGRRRRVKPTVPARPTIEPEQLPALLEAAHRLRPIVAVMAGAGLRNGEACGLDWPDFDPASGALRVAASKTDAGVRHVDLPQALRRELTALKLRTGAAARDQCSATATADGRASATSSAG